MRRIGYLAWLALVTLERPAFAQNTDPTPSYTVDAAQGPLTGSTRVIGLGGAYVAVAEGMDGIAVNPASVAVRLPYSWNRWDFSFGINFAIGGYLPETKFLNRGPRDQAGQQAEPEAEQRSLLFGSLGFIVYFEQAGFGMSAEGQQQALERGEDTSAGLAPTALSGNFGIVYASAGYGFFDGQFVLGAGPRVTGVSLSRASSSSGLLSVAGIGYQVGALYKPLKSGLRVGAAYKSEVRPSFERSAGGTPEQPIYNTTALRLPWQASAGFAYQFGQRPFNPELVTAEDQARPFREKLELDADARERELTEAERTYQHEPTAENDERLARVKARVRTQEKQDELALEEHEKKVDAELLRAYLARPRFYLLASTELLVLGPTSDSIDFASVYQNRSKVRFSGETLTLSPRLGVESEVIPNWLKLRAGTYLEPARVSGASDRLHGTGGFDVKLFRWNVFGLVGDFDSWLFSVAVDSAREYLSTSFSIGFWH